MMALVRIEEEISDFLAFIFIRKVLEARLEANYLLDFLLVLVFGLLLLLQPLDRLVVLVVLLQNFPAFDKVQH